MSRSSVILSALLLMPLACDDDGGDAVGSGGGDDSEMADTDDWVEGEIPDGNGGLPPGGPSDGGDGDEDGDEDGGEEPEALSVWFGEIERVDGMLGEGFLEFFAIDIVDGQELESCIITTPLTIVSEPQDCSSCEFAVELELTEVEVEVDVGCAEHGIDPASLTGTRIAVGYGGGEELFVREGEEWVLHGFAELLPEVFVFEYEPL